MLLKLADTVLLLINTGPSNVKFSNSTLLDRSKYFSRYIKIVVSYSLQPKYLINIFMTSHTNFEYHIVASSNTSF